jgi:hypothetical protein
MTLPVLCTKTYDQPPPLYRAIAIEERVVGSYTVNRLLSSAIDPKIFCGHLSKYTVLRHSLSETNYQLELETEKMERFLVYLLIVCRRSGAVHLFNLAREQRTACPPLLLASSLPSII